MFGRFMLNRTISRDRSVDPDDTLRVKPALERLGHYRRPDWGSRPGSTRR